MDIQDKQDMLRFSTAGSVDDGKSTLIGRLLYDSKSIFEDQLEAIEISTQRKGREGVDLALLTDGLEAEREQGITIDVAYRYFATPKRKFIIADTPGHEQYTRNMVTGCSTADLAIILIDARKGLLPQSRRHAFIAHLLRVSHILVCVNKMDLVNYDENIFQKIKEDFLNYTKDLSFHDLQFLPISALHGDNIVVKSAHMPWYSGSTLLETLETVKVFNEQNKGDLRFPVQYVNRPNHTYRGFCGQLASGGVKVGDDIVVLPSSKKSRVKAIERFHEQLSEVIAPFSVTLHLEDEIDISRGDMITHEVNQPHLSQEFRAHLCWMTEEPLHSRGQYLMKHCNKTIKVIIKNIEHRFDVETHAQQKTEQLNLNDIAEVVLKTTQPLVFDEYQHNRVTGSFILIDEFTNNTVAAGMILRPVK